MTQAFNSLDPKDQTEGQKPLDFVESKLAELHHDRDLAALLVKKLLAGCLKFEKNYNDIELDQTQTMNLYERPQAKLVSPEGNAKKVKKSENLPYKGDELKRKLREMRRAMTNEQQTETEGDEKGDENNPYRDDSADHANL